MQGISHFYSHRIAKAAKLNIEMQVWNFFFPILNWICNNVIEQGIAIILIQQVKRPHLETKIRR